MGLYQRVCYVVEDAIISLLLRKKTDNEKDEAMSNVRSFRDHKAKLQQEKERIRQEEIEKKRKAAEEKAEKERQETISILSRVMDLSNRHYFEHEFKEIKMNLPLFQHIYQEVYEGDEYGDALLRCTFKKSKNRVMPGYLISTNKRVWFVSRDRSHTEKFRYQTIKGLPHIYKGGAMVRGMNIQYGTKTLEFDEISDMQQTNEFVKAVNRRL